MTINAPRILLILAVIAGLGAAAPALGEKPPRYQYDQSFDFSKLHTFDITIHESKQREGEMATTVVPKLVQLLEDLLTAKGYAIDTAKPDFILEWDTAVAPDMNSDSYAGHAMAAKGLLALRTKQPGQEEPFWIGSDVADVNGRITADKAWKKVDHAARRILDGFPPK
jgi:hypothetical protein